MIRRSGAAIGTWGSWATGAMAGVLLLLGAGACAPSADGDEAGGGAAVEAAAEPAVYVDVRTREEFAAGHVEGAINIPVEELPTRWRELERYRDEHVVVYCRTGNRSGVALTLLKQAGFSNIENGGGFAGLQRQGVPTAR